MFRDLQAPSRDVERAELGYIVGYGPGVRRQVFVRGELGRVDKDGDDGVIALRQRMTSYMTGPNLGQQIAECTANGLTEVEVTFVQRPHGRNEADALCAQ